MNKANKTISLFLAALLFYVSINTEFYYLSINSVSINSDSGNSISYFSINKSDFFLLNRQEENLVVSVKNQPDSYSKYHASDFYVKSFSQHLRLLSKNSGYISFSEAVNLNLTTNEIIFPFQYFW